MQKKLPAIETFRPQPLAVWFSGAVGIWIRFTRNNFDPCGFGSSKQLIGQPLT
jgi:hypothetical protein